MNKKILMVLTSHEQLGDSGKQTGFWPKEFAAPYSVSPDARALDTLASPKGGQPPLDPKGDDQVTFIGVSRDLELCQAGTTAVLPGRGLAFCKLGSGPHRRA